MMLLKGHFGKGFSKFHLAIPETENIAEEESQ